MGRLLIIGYQLDSKCQHCNRNLKHGIRLSDGRVVGATCLDKKLTKPKLYHGRTYRLGAELIINAAKVVEFKASSEWSRFGVSSKTIEFESV